MIDAISAIIICIISFVVGGIIVKLSFYPPISFFNENWSSIFISLITGISTGVIVTVYYKLRDIRLKIESDLNEVISIVGKIRVNLDSLNTINLKASEFDEYIKETIKELKMLNQELKVPHKKVKLNNIKSDELQKVVSNVSDMAFDLESFLYSDVSFSVREIKILYEDIKVIKNSYFNYILYQKRTKLKKIIRYFKKKKGKEKFISVCERYNNLKDDLCKYKKTLNILEHNEEFIELNDSKVLNELKIKIKHVEDDIEKIEKSNLIS